MIRKIAEDLAQELLSVENRQRKLKGDRLERLIRSIEHLIKDSVSVRFSRSRYSWASISKRPGYYSKSIYNKSLSYRIHVKLAYEGMRSMGYLSQERLGASDGSLGRYRTKYVATPKLLRKFSNIDRAILPVISGPQPIDEPIRVQVDEPIEANSGGRPETRKKLLNYEDTPQTERMRLNLMRINEAIASRWIDLELSDDGFVVMQSLMRSRKDRHNEDDRQLNLTKTQLYRVFNDPKFNTGGRFYGGWWQNIPKQYRHLITIDGKRTIEADFSSLHPSILYAKQEIEPPQDAYSNILPNLPRDVAKKAFNAMINAEAPMLAQPRGMKLSTCGYRWQDVVKAMYDRHWAIKDAFFSGAGKFLQRIDSDLAERTMLSFMDYATPVTILPVHDSFIMHHGYQDELAQFMQAHFQDMFGFNINIGLEYGVQGPYVEMHTTDNVDDLLDNMTGSDKRFWAFRAVLA
jgi:hypothetical protein